ncbi:hypothetical protein J5N97_014692 [Dioscorea zingiberensis]|uniref:Uncharacterized protein n=1 Tax=Dioscorea zingiberensis TaxID=325984 RepID=A0A9D5HK07_9LILI|nr:hypothetical protein J5N97_014692 [Dioscorea zingiberensis]
MRQSLPSLEWLRKSSGFKEKLEKSFEIMDQLFEREIVKHCFSGDGDGDGDGERNLLSVLLKHQADSNLGFSFKRDDIKAIIQIKINFGCVKFDIKAFVDLDAICS